MIFRELFNAGSITALILTVFTVSAIAEPSSERVVILANAADPESVNLARYYAEKRQLPTDNIVSIPMPTVETITWPTFISTIYNPLQADFAKRGWIDATETELLDHLGRRKYLITGHRIRYLVVCRGVPLRIEEDPNLFTANPPLTDTAQFRTNAASVDSELTLLARSGYAINAFLVNPLFGKDRPSYLDLGKVIKVSRLDGPSYADAAALVDHALAGEQNGLIGRAYVDIGGIHPEGDAWLRTVAGMLDELGFDSSVDQLSSTFPATARFDAPVLYFGWYASDLNGPFAVPEFRFPPGAIALHIHSYSARTLRSANQGWTGPLIARGVTATFGNVYEPYLALTQRPIELLRSLSRGDTFGDAAYYSMPALSWQGVVIGDPLYRPFAESMTRQWERRKQLPEDLFPYVALRMIRILERGENLEEAVKLADEVMASQPSLPIAVKRAQLAKKQGDLAAGRFALRYATGLDHVKPTDLPLAAEAGDLMVECGAATKAVVLFKALLASDTIDRDLRVMLLGHAEKAARAGGNAAAAELWKAEAALLIGQAAK